MFQLEGKEKWMLYKPQQELAREFDSDFSPSDLGEATHELELEVKFLVIRCNLVKRNKCKPSRNFVNLMVYLDTFNNSFYLNGICDLFEIQLLKTNAFCCFLRSKASQ